MDASQELFGPISNQDCERCGPLPLQSGDASSYVGDASSGVALIISDVITQTCVNVKFYCKIENRRNKLPYFEINVTQIKTLSLRLIPNWGR